MTLECSRFNHQQQSKDGTWVSKQPPYLYSVNHCSECKGGKLKIYSGLHSKLTNFCVNQLQKISCLLEQKSKIPHVQYFKLNLERSDCAGQPEDKASFILVLVDAMLIEISVRTLENT